MATTTGEKAPLTRSPLFAGLVALWCAVGMGAGGLALPPSLLEGAVTRLDLAALVPAAAPPLGFTARLLLALALALIGAAAGFLIARRLTRGPAAPEDAAPAARPLTAEAYANAATDEEHRPAATDDNDDLARLDAARSAVQPGRRRALTSEASLGLEAPAILHLGELDSIAEAEVESEPAQEPVPTTLPLAPEPVAASEPAAPPQADSPLTALSIAELVERFGRALAARSAARAEPEPQPETVAEAQPEAPAEAPAEARPEAMPEAMPISQPQPSLPPAEAVTVAQPAPAPVSRAQHPAFAPERPFDMPAALRQTGLGAIEWFDDAADEAEAAATLESLRLPRVAAPAAEARPALPDAAPEEANEDPAEAVADEAFSSLLGMKGAARAPGPFGTFVRVEETESDPAEHIAEPVVTFPGQAVPPRPVPARLSGAPFGASQVETEAALRDALAALQKMSGTA
ncbi:hypothetical protein H7F51_02675 [Novosphingobium flavum]|uniref:Uncharacterized protein n=1 Tax=Novosphingobium flavum TaxID=1778672 RepID=A0A7X1FPD5_9SPHN|nr:hypothetical protein [Novosphingobium flavum]MBC2664418.1 hypothetical protein [Novosphingobium flavum]